jgi:hypothetical protein
VGSYRNRRVKPGLSVNIVRGINDFKVPFESTRNNGAPVRPAQALISAEIAATLTVLPFFTYGA